MEKVSIGWGYYIKVKTIYPYWPREIESVNSIAPYSYDCDSIMQYAYMKIINSSCTSKPYNPYNPLTEYNDKITTKDANTIKYLYR